MLKNLEKVIAKKITNKKPFSRLLGLLEKMKKLKEEILKHSLEENYDNSILLKTLKGKFDLYIRVSAENYENRYEEEMYEEYFSIPEVDEAANWLIKNAEKDLSIDCEIIAVNGKYYYRMFNFHEIPALFKVLNGLSTYNYIPYKSDYYTAEYVTAVRWLGAFNTGTNGHRKFSFEDVLNYETNKTEREVAAQAGRTLTEIQSLKDGDCDQLQYSKVGVMYDNSDVLSVFGNDVWSLNVGSKLVPTRINPGSEYREKDNDVILSYTKGLLEEIFDEDTAKSIFYLENINNYSDVFSCNGSNRLFLQEIIDTLSEEEISNLRKLDIFKDFARKTLLAELENKIKRANIKDIYYENNKYHTECFIAKGAKPVAIIISGRIRNKNFAVVKKIAKQKGLQIININPYESKAEEKVEIIDITDLCTNIDLF